jgi:hypothetical protein
MVLVTRDISIQNTVLAAIVSELPCDLVVLAHVIAELMIATGATLISAADFHVRTHHSLFACWVWNRLLCLSLLISFVDC